MRTIERCTRGRCTNSVHFNKERGGRWGGGGNDLLADEVIIILLPLSKDQLLPVIGISFSIIL